MKQTLKPGKQYALSPEKRRELSSDLKHVLSPLEQAALKHYYKPFVYDYDGIGLYIGRRACKRFIDCARDKITFLTNLVEHERLSLGIPAKYREAFDDPRIIMDLPPRLRNRLFGLGCYTLFAIMQNGRGYFLDEQQFSWLAMRRLDELFVRYKCERLFE